MSTTAWVDTRYKVVLPNGRETWVCDSGGEGPALLLIHGLFDSSRVSFESAARLLRRWRVVMVDLPEHGLGARDRGACVSLIDAAIDLRHVMVARKVDKVTVVGHSTGGHVAAHFAAMYPELVARLVLVATEPEFQHRDTARLRRAARLEFVWRLSAPVLRWYMSRRKRRSRSARAVLEGFHYLGDYLRASERGLFNAAVAAAQSNITTELGEVTCPVGIVVTTNDSVVAPERQRAMAGLVRRSPLVRIVELDSDHGAPWHAPDAFVDALETLMSP